VVLVVDFTKCKKKSAMFSSFTRAENLLFHRLPQQNISIVDVRINIISELFRLVEKKSNSLI